VTAASEVVAVVIAAAVEDLSLTDIHLSTTEQQQQWQLVGIIKYT
jgi:hypothetical protein